jgi:hypothetical protein
MIAKLVRWISAIEKPENNYSTPTFFDKEQQEVIGSVKHFIEDKLSTRPSFITFVATLERMLLSNSFNIENCQECRVKLKNKLWQLLEYPVSSPTTRENTFSSFDELIKDYSDVLRLPKAKDLN